MQNTSPIFELMQYHNVDLIKWSWTNLHHGWSKKGHEIRIKTISPTQCENMIVRKSWSKQDALHIPSTRLKTSTWRWCAIMLVRKAGSRRTDTQSRKSATNINIPKCDLFDDMFERKTCSMRDAIHSPRVRTKTTTWRLFVNITGCKYLTHKTGTQSQIPDQNNFAGINLKRRLWEKTEACEMQNNSPFFEL